MGAAALLLAVPAVPARAAQATHVSASGPHRVKVGHSAKLTFTGYAGAGVPALWVLLDNRSCASTEPAEAGRREIRHHARFHVKHHFKAELTVERSVAGTHYACAYLVRRRHHATVAWTSWRYVTKR